MDFPIVNWVVQLDCPEDATAYIHRAGRTARHTARGESLLVLLPSEENTMIEELKEYKIPINKIHIDPKKMFSPKAKIEAFLAQNLELKESAQRAFISYIKSVVLMKNKQIFNVDALNTDAFAKSLGLVHSPRIRFLQRMRKARQQNAEAKDDSQSSDADTENEEADFTPKVQKIKSSINTAFLSNDDDDDADNFIKVKRKDHEILEEHLPSVAPLETIKLKKRKNKPLTKAAVAKKLLKKKILPNTKKVFNEDGHEIDPLNKFKSEKAKEYENAEENGINIEKVKELMKEEDKYDKEHFKMLVKIKHKAKKNKLKNRLKGAEEEKDDFGSDDSGPDLAWLPDPKNDTDDSESDDDDVYNGREIVNSSDESYSDYEHDQSSDIEIQQKDVKRKYTITEVANKKSQQHTFKKSRKLASNFSLDETELFAMKLLQK